MLKIPNKRKLFLSITFLSLCLVGNLSLSFVENGSSKKTNVNSAACPAALTGPILELQNGVFSQLTPEGKVAVERTAHAVSENFSRYNSFFQGQDELVRTHLLTMLMRQNHLLLGPPGGAKTMGIDWLIGKTKLWSKQIAEWTTPSEIFGGMTRKGIENGTEDINTTGSALESEYVMLDEINNANPTLLGALLSFLNPGERRIQIQGKSFKAITRAIFSTGNATRTQILDFFTQRNLQSGPAMLNRFLFKSYVFNWLKTAQQLKIDQFRRKVETLKSDMMYGSEQEKKDAKEALENILSLEIDTAPAERLAWRAFEITPELDNTLRVIANKLREQINKKAMDSRLQQQEDPRQIPFEPSTEWSERTRGFLEQLVRMSATLDLLLLPQEKRQKLLAMGKPIPLSGLSVSRIAKIITTGPGLSYFNPISLKMEFNIVNDERLGWVKMDLGSEATDTKDPLEAHSILELEEEQTIFNQVLNNVLTELNLALSTVAMLENVQDLDLDNVDFEHIVFKELNQEVHSALSASGEFDQNISAEPNTSGESE